MGAYVFDPAEADAVVRGDEDHRPHLLYGWVESGGDPCDSKVLKTRSDGSPAGALAPVSLVGAGDLL